jgi:NitT/TauT family transport system permease protein
MPSMIWDQIVEWVRDGTSQGSLWRQVAVTLEETVLGFLIGSVAGVFCGILLGRNKLLSDIFSLYIQIANSIPAWCWARSSSSPWAWAWPPRWRWRW